MSSQHATATTPNWFSEDPVRRCNADAPISTIVVNDIVHALMDVVNELEDSFTPIEQAGSWFVQRFPDHPSQEFFQLLDRSTQRASRAQKRAVLAATHARTMLDFMMQGLSVANPEHRDPFDLTHHDPLPGDYRTRTYHVIPNEGYQPPRPRLEIHTSNLNEYDLPAYQPHHRRQVFISDTDNERGVTYLLVPPIGEPRTLQEFQVRSQWIGQKVVVLPIEDSEGGDGFVTVGGDELGPDELGTDDDLGEGRYWSSPLRQLPRVPGDVTWQRWVYRHYNGAHIDTHGRFVRALYHLHSRHGYLDQDEPYFPSSVNQDADQTVHPHFGLEKRDPNVHIPGYWCRCMVRWDPAEVETYNSWEPETKWFPPLVSTPGLAPSTRRPTISTNVTVNPASSSSKLSPTGSTASAKSNRSSKSAGSSSSRRSKKSRKGVLVETVGLPLHSNYRPAPSPPPLPVRQSVPTVVGDEPFEFDDVATGNINEEPCGDY